MNPATQNVPDLTRNLHRVSGKKTEKIKLTTLSFTVHVKLLYHIVSCRLLSYRKLDLKQTGRRNCRCFGILVGIFYKKHGTWDNLVDLLLLFPGCNLRVTTCHHRHMAFYRMLNSFISYRIPRQPKMRCRKCVDGKYNVAEWTGPVFI